MSDRASRRVGLLVVSCPCHVMGQAGGPCTARGTGPCWHGHANYRAVGRAAGPWAAWPYS